MTGGVGGVGGAWWWWVVYGGWLGGVEGKQCDVKVR